MSPIHRYSTEEIKIVKEGYASLAKTELMSLLPKRTWVSILTKATRLGLCRRSGRFQEGSSRNLTSFQKGYVSAFLDGEGQITISRHVFKKGPRNRGSIALQPRIDFSNRKKAPLEYIKTVIGGGWFYFRKRKRKAYSDRWRLVVTKTKDIKHLLQQITPYLKVKKPQAKLMLEFCTLRLNAKIGERSPREVEIYKELRQLNKRGPHHG